MGSPEKPVDVEMGDVSESAQLNPEKTSEDHAEKSTRFTGLTKEELLEISGQPGWVRARWLLFILFWLVWVGMLVGAIVIVIQAPRCKPDPELAWYQAEVGYAVDSTFGEAQDHLDYVKGLSAKSVIVKGMSASDDAFAQLLASKEEKQNKEFKFIAEVAYADTPEATATGAQEWIDAGADGVLVSIGETITSGTATSLQQTIYDSVKEAESPIAVYFNTADDAISQALYDANNMTTVLLSEPFDDCVGQPNAGECFRTAFAHYRGAEERSVVGYMLSAGFNNTSYQDGLNLLMLALPGVSIIRSADEFAGDQTADFVWKENKSKDQVPARSVESEELGNFKKMSPKKAPGIEQESSLRFDAVDGSEWKYIAEDATGAFAFCRKWDTKPTILVVSNMTPDQVTVDAQGCLMKGDENNLQAVESASPSDWSDTDAYADLEGELTLATLTVASGQTVVFKG